MSPKEKYLELVIIAIFIFCNITNVSSDQDSVNLDNSYGNKQQALRRYQRQTTFNTNMCLIPIFPIHTNYKILDLSGSTYKPGDNVTNLSILRTICDKGYKLNPFAQNISVCIEGTWTPELTYCARACPSLNSTVSANVNCTYNDRQLNNCLDPVEETTVVLSCNPLYEYSTKDQDLGHLCIEGKWEPSIRQCNPVCGRKRPVGTVNIINGRDTVSGNYPWHVGIYLAADQSYKCGGVIIARNIILSAAHCFTDYLGKVQPPESFLVGAGKYHRMYDHNNDTHAQYSTIHKINVPERYRGLTTSYALDIAVLVLENPFSISVAVQPVCIELHEQLQQLYLSPQSIGIVTGWGYTIEGGNLAEVLKEVEIPHIPYEKCFEEIPMNFKQYYTRDKICGGYRNLEISICTGDSGGGLVFNNIITDRYYIKGVVSTSPATLTMQCDRNQYSLYTSIADHVRFIRDVITQNYLHYSAECKYDKCASEDLEEINRNNALTNEQKYIEIANSLLNKLLTTLGFNGSDDDLCGSDGKCSCNLMLFKRTSSTKDNFANITQKVVRTLYTTYEPNGSSEETNCKPGDSKCVLYNPVFVKIPGDSKELLQLSKRIIEQESASNQLYVEIFEDYDKCSLSNLLQQMALKLNDILFAN